MEAEHEKSRIGVTYRRTLPPTTPREGGLTRSIAEKSGSLGELGHTSTKPLSRHAMHGIAITPRESHIIDLQFPSGLIIELGLAFVLSVRVEQFGVRFSVSRH